MKILPLAISLCVSFSAAAYHVSSQPQLKNLLLEEATGLLCTSCPHVQPHLDRVASTYPTLNMIAIHGMHFRDKLFDLSTPGGDEIVTVFDIMSYPQAMIDRVQFEGMNTRFISDAFWDKFLAQRSQEQAPVNLWMYSSLDEASGIVTVTVEGYFLEDVSGLNPHLTVVMTQDGIIAPQAGAGAAKDTWESNHVLRDFLTPTWGTKLENVKKGEYFTQKIEYELPEKVGIFAVIPEDVHFVAFVTEDKINVMNSISSDIVYEPLEEEKVEADFDVDSSAKIEGEYGYNFVDVYLTNTGNVPLTSGVFAVTLNGETEEVDWIGYIESDERSLVRIPTSWFDSSSFGILTGINRFSVTCLKLNGVAVNEIVAEGTFSKPNETSKELRLTVTSLAQEFSLTLKDADGNVVQTFAGKGEYEEIFKLGSQSVYCLESASTTELMPLAADGVISLYDVRMEQPLLEEVPLDNLKYFLMTTQAPAGVELTATEDGNVTVYDLNGRIVPAESLRPGIYVMKNGTSTRKIIVR